MVNCDLLHVKYNTGEKSYMLMAFFTREKLTKFRYHLNKACKIHNRYPFFKRKPADS